jgi:hypothetical protein
MIRFTIPPKAIPSGMPGFGEGLVLDFDDGRMMLSEARILEKNTGARISEIHREFLAGGELGISAYVWLALVRNDLRVKYSELDFDMAKVVCTRVDDPPADEDQADDVDAVPDGEVPPTTAAA